MPSVVPRLVYVEITGIVVGLYVSGTPESVSSDAPAPDGRGTLLSVHPPDRNAIAVVERALDLTVKIGIANPSAETTVQVAALSPGLATQEETEKSESSEFYIERL